MKFPAWDDVWPYLIGMLLGGIILSLAFYSQRLPGYLGRIAPFVILGVTLIICFVILNVANSDSTKAQLDKLQKEKQEITQKIEEKTTPDIFYIIQLNLNQLTEYYTINKGQAKRSFNFSIGAASLGFITILAGMWFYYLKVKDVPVSYITSIAGVILEFIGGAYFFIYKKSLEQVGLFFGQLIKVQDTMLAIDLAKQNDKPERRSELQEKIIVSLLERSLK